MVNSGLQIVGCITGCLGGLFNLLATFLPEWKTNESSDLDAIARFEGLWVKCVTYPSGLWQCESYDDFFIDLPKALQVGRALSCSSIFFGFIAYVATIMGMECTTCLTAQESGKTKLILIGALLWIMAAILSGASVSYYAYLILWEYNSDYMSDTEDKYMYGSCLYLGWSSLILGVFGGLFVGCGGLQKSQRSSQFLFQHSPPKARPNQTCKPFLNTEYV